MKSEKIYNIIFHGINVYYNEREAGRRSPISPSLVNFQFWNSPSFLKRLFLKIIEKCDVIDGIGGVNTERTGKACTGRFNRTYCKWWLLTYEMTKKLRYPRVPTWWELCFERMWATTLSETADSIRFLLPPRVCYFWNREGNGERRSSVPFAWSTFAFGSVEPSSIDVEIVSSIDPFHQAPSQSRSVWSRIHLVLHDAPSVFVTVIILPSRKTSLFHHLHLLPSSSHLKSPPLTTHSKSSQDN